MNKVTIVHAIVSVASLALSSRE